jgi:hypothetical protein
LFSDAVQFRLPDVNNEEARGSLRNINTTGPEHTGPVAKRK